MQIPEVKEYYDILKKRKFSLVLKRLFDITVSFILLLFLSPLFLVLAIAIKLDSKGPVFYRQTRVTQYGEEFRIFKFRSMVTDADKGSLLTVGGYSRITRTGKFIRKYKLDEFSQLIDVLRGTMTFVGTRPEVPKYVEKYTPETDEEYKKALEAQVIRDKKEAERQEAKAQAAARVAEAKEAALARAAERARESAEKKERAAKNAKRQQQRNGEDSRNQQKKGEEMGVKNENSSHHHKNRYGKNRHRHSRAHQNGEKGKNEQ